MPPVMSAMPWVARDHAFERRPPGVSESSNVFGVGAAAPSRHRVATTERISSFQAVARPGVANAQQHQQLVAWHTVAWEQAAHTDANQTGVEIEIGRASCRERV